MKSPLTFLFALIAATLASATTLPSQTSPLYSAKELRQGYRDHVILARPHATRRATVDDEEKRDGVQVREKFARFGDLRVITLADSDSSDAAIARLRATGRYEFVEPDYIRSIQATPNDPKFGDNSMWALNNVGQRGNVDGVQMNGVAGADIHAAAAWDIIHDAPNVVVAIVDTGIALTHQDIVDNLWTNPNPTNSDLHGANFVGGNGRMVSGNPADDEGHGTHVAGTVGAFGNNGTASVGVAWKVQLMAVKVMGSNGQGFSSDIIAGINYAITHGATIINASFGADAAPGTTGYSASELSAIAGAATHGTIFVAAAGNAQPPSFVPVNLDIGRAYPASFAVDNIVTVGSSNRRDLVSSFSYYGAAVDLFAPGDDIVSLDYGTTSGTVVMDGTSMATPHVVGALALLKAQFPSDTYRQSINRLLRGVDRGAAFTGKCQTGGRLNLYKSLTTTTSRPFNNDFADRPHFNTDSLSIRTSNVGATAESGDPSIAGSAPNATLWWEWTAPSSGNVTVSTSGSSYDTVLAIYAGSSLGGLTVVASNDDDGGVTTSRVAFSARAGTTYQIAVDGKNGGTGLTLLSLGTTPANDTFAGATVLSGQSVSLAGANLHCSREVGEPVILGFAGGNSLWYQWTAPRTGRFQVSASSIDFDPILAVYTGNTLTALTLVSASDNTGTDSAQTAALCTIEATAGTTYRITLDSKNANSAGTFTLTLVDSLWQATTGAAVTGSPAVASDGTVYVGGTDKNFYAFGADGSQKWTVATGGGIDTCSAAIADDGTVYFGSFDGYFYAVSPSGATKWKHQIGNSTVDTAYSPAVGADGTIYTRASDGYLYALRSSDGSQVWRANIVSTATNFYGNPVVGADGTIYQGSDENDKKLYAFNPDGSTKWTQPLDSGAYGAPAIDAAGNLYLTTLAGGVYSFTGAGTQRWHVTISANISSSVALSNDGGTMYFAGYDGKLYARDTANGAVRWTFDLGTEVRASSPAVDANGVIYVGCYDHKLYAVNADGTKNRDYATADVVRSSPVIAGTRLYFGSNDQKVYAFDLPAGPSPGVWSQYRANIRRLGRIVNDTLRVTTQPSPQTAVIGQSFTLSVTATGQPPLTYQWRKDGTAIAGATSSSYTVSNVGTDSAGAYTVVISGPQGSVTSSAAAITVQAASPGRLVNLSVRTTAASNDRTLIVGVSIAGTSGKPLLIRGIGPSLAQYFGIADALMAPQLTVLNQDTKAVVAANSGWGGSATLAAAFNAVGAFGLPSTSKDDALTAAIPAGGYTVQITGANNTAGTALAEVYDLDPLDTSTGYSRLTNLSARAQIGTGSNVLIAGFSISGNVPKKLLIRGIGPTLTAFGVGGTLANPKLEIFDQNNTLQGSNDDWGGSATLTQAFNQVQAFGLADSTSKDAALVITLSPGSYSAEVSGVGGTTGVGLVEVYEMP